jgi:glutamate-ammonia-ligase adenylyltransferase
MAEPAEIEQLISDLPDADAARRFYSDLLSQNAQTSRINEALLSDLLTLSAYSPLLATTVLQNPDYIQWLARERTDTKVRSNEELLESLSRFSLLHTDLTPNVMLARFRRRELLRIFLRDIRRLATIAEITEELSNLADAVIEFSLRLARQELENRFGTPLETDERGRATPAGFCVFALGKLGSRELNYASDIDLLFVYSSEGTTSEAGTNPSITNREFFIKVAEHIIRTAGGQSGEGSAYRIDMRLRPHGSIGRLALSLDETVRYYKSEARDWEQQVLIRSRPIAGQMSLFKQFFSDVESTVFREDIDAATALENVRLSKRRIEDPTPPGPGFNVKLGRGGIREIEFMAQALQLAYAGRDPWLRFPHTLVSLSRLADRGFISERDLTRLFDAYNFLRRVEHLIQMEHGLQNHTVPRTNEGRRLLARRAGFADEAEFDRQIERHARHVQGVFERVFTPPGDRPNVPGDRSAAFERSRDLADASDLAAVSPHFAQLASSLDENDVSGDSILSLDPSSILAETDFSHRLETLRKAWARSIVSIAAAEIRGEIDIAESKSLQTGLAESSLKTTLVITADEMRLRYNVCSIDLNILALGKLGGRGVDYGSDLDIVIVYPDGELSTVQTSAEIYAKAVEILLTAVSGVTRHGSLYRVDLRLRPFGKNGASANPASAFVDYFRETAEIWELLAFVKLRGAAGSIASDIEQEVRGIIHRRALENDRGLLRRETLRIRDLLERERAGRYREVDIKYGPGGMLDVYFASRYLQLRDNVPDPLDQRSTLAILELLREAGSLSPGQHDLVSVGYSFISELDHNIRLTTGRSRRLPTNVDTLETIARRMSLPDRAALSETLSLHRLNIRKVFEEVLK